MTRHTPEDDNESGSEIGVGEIERATEYFTVKDNTSPFYTVELRASYSTPRHSPKPWGSLEDLVSIKWNGITYKIGDIIHVRQDDERDPVEIAEVAEIKDLGDTRSVLRVFWFCSRDMVKRTLQRKDLRAWPRDRMNIKSTHMDVVMWDCATGKLSKADLRTICEGKVLNMSAKAPRVRRKDLASVSWAKARVASNRSDRLLGPSYQSDR